MTSLLNIAGNAPTDAFAEGSSLRFEDGDSAYLSFTPASAGNRDTWTWSGWVKRGNLTDGYLFGAGDGGNRRTAIYFDANKLTFINRNAPTTYDLLTTNAVFRDTSAYYHIVAVRDALNSTSSDRLRIYVNGERITSFLSATYPSTLQGYVGVSTYAHEIGRNPSDTSRLFDGYLANVCFIDGQALTPTSFGEYEDTLWKPKSDTDIQALTFGTNGFYLPFKQTTEAEGFSTVTYTGTSSQQAIEGVGFEPDLVWLKARSSTGYDHVLQDSVRGSTKQLYSNSTSAEVDDTDAVTSFDSSGFTTGADVTTNNSGVNYVAWCWDAGTGSAASNTDGSITSSVKANTTNGFSIATYTGNGTAGATFGHGLSSAPEMVIVKNRTDAENWSVFHDSLGNTKGLTLNSTDSGLTSTTYWNDTSPTSSVVSLGSDNSTNGSGDSMVAYCFHSVSGYSSIGSYSGTGAAGNSITGLGFKPAFVMIKDSTNSGNSWVILDNTRDTTDPRESALFPDGSYAEADLTTGYISSFDADGFTVAGSGGAINTSGATMIYMAIADTRDATFFGDTSGNGNNWTPNKLNNTDVVPDSPVTNFAVLNPLVNVTGGSFSEGNLKVTTGSSQYGPAVSSFAVSSGKWYCEFLTTASSGDQRIGGVRVGTNLTTTYDLGNSGSFAYRQNDGQKKVDGTQSAYGATWAVNDIIGMALNLDDDEVTFYKNGSSQGTFSITTGEYFLATSDGDSGAGMGAFANFGQDSSFAGTKTPQGNTDDNGQGDFYYAPPSGFLALNRNNLPTPDILDPADYFNTVLYSGNGSTQSITGVNFQPDWVWAKARNGAFSHGLFDSVRGATKRLQSQSTAAEDTTGLTSFDSDGFTTSNYNSSGYNYVAWNWLAGGTAVSNTDGSITSQVSANQDAGFSVVSYSGNGTAGATVGHGLSSTPELVLLKDRSGTDSWRVYSSETGGTKSLYLNLTNAASTDSTIWNNTAPTSSVFTIGNDSGVNTNTNNYIAYCFHSVEGYSKIGSGTGTGASSSNFIHTGFRPAFVMIKRTDSTDSWVIFDNERPSYNVTPNRLFPDLSSSESTSSSNQIDMVSNGFVARGTSMTWNASGSSFIFIAFAEAPFKNANAR